MTISSRQKRCSCIDGFAIRHPQCRRLAVAHASAACAESPAPILRRPQILSFADRCKWGGPCAVRAGEPTAGDVANRHDSLTEVAAQLHDSPVGGTRDDTVALWRGEDAPARVLFQGVGRNATLGIFANRTAPSGIATGGIGAVRALPGEPFIGTAGIGDRVAAMWASSFLAGVRTRNPRRPPGKFVHHRPQWSAG